MKKSTPVIANIIINAVIAVILTIVANQIIFTEENPFGGFVQEFLIIFFIIMAADMIWKLLKNFINKKIKK